MQAHVYLAQCSLEPAARVAREVRDLSEKRGSQKEQAQSWNMLAQAHLAECIVVFIFIIIIITIIIINNDIIIVIIITYVCICIYDIMNAS